jgi:hypothetical protein
MLGIRGPADAVGVGGSPTLMPSVRHAARMLPAGAWFSALALIVAGPLLGGGYLLLLDFPSGPRFPRALPAPPPELRRHRQRRPIPGTPCRAERDLGLLPDKLLLLAPLDDPSVRRPSLLSVSLSGLRETWLSTCARSRAVCTRVTTRPRRCRCRAAARDSSTCIGGRRRAPAGYVVIRVFGVGSWTDVTLLHSLRRSHWRTAKAEKPKARHSSGHSPICVIVKPDSGKAVARRNL